MEPGQIVGEKYKVIRELGRGAMGAVFEVEHVYIKKRFALKSINAELAKNPEFRARALRESQASAAIRHPNIVDVSDFGESKDGAPYIVMEFLDGRPLTDIIEEQAPMSALRALRITIEILDGLQAAHDAGIVHRDIKPDNIFVLSESKPDAPRIKIVDFGISKMKTTEQGMTLTRTNAVMGTPYYMSLEQCRGARDVDGRADVFSVGVILFELLSRRIPFEADTFAELVVKMVKAERTPLAEVAPWLAASVVALVEKATAVERTDRFNSASEMLAEIKRILETTPNLDAAPEAAAVTADKEVTRLSETEATTYESVPSRSLSPSPGSVSQEPAHISKSNHGSGEGDESFYQGEVTEQVELPSGQDNMPEFSHPSRRWLLPGLTAGLVSALTIGYFVLRANGSQKRPPKPHNRPVDLPGDDAGAVSRISGDAGRSARGRADTRTGSDASFQQPASDAGTHRDAAAGRTGRLGNQVTTGHRNSRAGTPGRTRGGTGTRMRGRARPRTRSRTRPRTRSRGTRRFRLKTDD